MAAVHPSQDAAVLDDSGRLYRLIADTIPLMVWTARADGRVDFVNQRVLEYTGLDARRLEGWGWEAIVHPDDREQCRATWLRALESGDPSENEMRLRRADGEYRWHHGSGVPLRDGAGRVVRWFGICTDIQNEEHLRALREAQARLRALIDNEPECVKLLDAQGRLLEMNAAGLRMIEVDSAEAVLGKCVYGIVAPEHVGAFRDLTERVCRGERGTLEFEMVGFKGTRRWLETHAVPFRDEASGETRLLSITRDITDRKRAEQALRESEHRFQLFMENLPAHAWIRDARSRFTFVNRRYADTWGAGDRAALLGRVAADIYPPEVAAYFLATDAEVREQGAPIQFVDSLPAGRWLKVKFPVPDRDGGVGVAGIALDITERSRLEEALRQSEQRFRSFMEHAPAAAWIKDARFRYTYVNRTYELVYGRAASEVLGREDFDLHAPALARSFRDEDERIQRTGEAAQKLHEVPYADGRPGHWVVVKFPLGDAAGETSVAGIALDVTPRLEAEEKARQYAEEVHDLVKRLVQAQEAERRRVAGELHDLIGQNLTALGIDLQALKQRLQSGGDLIAGPRFDAMAGLLDTTIDAIRGVMTDLRPAALEEFGLVPALRWHASQFGKRTGMKVSTHTEGRDLRLAQETELALFRIVQEAMTNAAKHSGGTAVDITVVWRDARLRVTVEDDGCGFAQPAGARRRGFGLPTMRERAEAHGGSLRVEFPQRGTRVVVEIPTVLHAD
jgi:PAS domain S-box-containing protein